MYRSIRSSTPLVRAAAASPLLMARAGGARRLASSAAGGSKRTWKGAAARWGLAGAALYWYNTSPIFNEDLAPVPAAGAALDATTPVTEQQFRTVDSLLEEKQKEARAAADKEKKKRAAVEQKLKEQKEQQQKEQKEQKEPASDSEAPPPAEGSPEALEAEASQQGAFNPETGEINWDCPCLGGMANGPCGEDFKLAFSCFIFSEEEPKGMDCIDKFQHMQDCFRKYPEIYGSELQDDDEAEGAAGAPTEAAKTETKQMEQKETKETPVAAAVGKVAETTESVAAKVAEKTEAAVSAVSSAAKAGAPTSTPPVDHKDDVVQAPIKAKTPSTTLIPAAATDATGASALPETQPPKGPSKDGVLPKAAFDATGANK